MKNNNKPKARWNNADRFAFATQNLRASSIPGRRQDGPTRDEWGWEDDGEDDE